MDLVYAFPGTQDAGLNQVGGKGGSLILLSAAKFRVPPGFVLTTNFFLPWVAQLKQSPAWHQLLTASQANRTASWQALKESCAALPFDQQQSETLFESFDKLAGEAKETFQVAVRSSAPEEDLEGASFAGGYLSLMGVTRKTLPDSVRQAFSSCLDPRVAVYKTMRGFDPLDPKIAIVVQSQIASEVAGVGFSLNPLSNDFDEAVINSNWGLGETVVAGLSTPDTFLVNKVSFHTLKAEIGSKQLSLWLDENGQTISREGHQSNQPSLNENQILRVSRLICEVEQLFRKPIDIEWSLHENHLYLLQARPITAYAPVAPDMVTTPGSPRRLYLDATISVQGISKPLSVVGTTALKLFLATFLKRMIGPKVASFFIEKLARIEHGKLYLSMSTAIGAAGQRRVAAGLRNMDGLAAETVATVDAGRYVQFTDAFPPALKTAFVLGVARLLIKAVKLWHNPEQVHRRSQEAFEEFLHNTDFSPSTDMTVREYARHAVDRTIELIAAHSIPLFMSAKLAHAALHRLFPDEPLVGQLDKALLHNMTVQMGLELAQLASLLPAQTTPDDLERGFRGETLPADFISGWNNFLERYGHRGPLEIDVASARFRDDPQMLLSQVSALTFAANPALRQKKAQTEREEAYETLLTKTHGPKRTVLKRLYNAILILGGYRETHKYFLALALWLIKQRIIIEGQLLYDSGRLESSDQVFDLTLDEISQAQGNEQTDLRALAAANRAFPDKLAQAPYLPSVFDSRGRILRPPVPHLKPGELSGSPISAGVAKGPVKVLHSPDEKPFLSGDVLVARATDPGWTPLFASASAVILEVGGMLQHGALVAREYGLPCVAGVANVTNILNDYALVEVDGSAGIIRLLDQDQAQQSEKRP